MSGTNLTAVLVGVSLGLAVVGYYWIRVYGPAARETRDRREASRVVTDELLDWLDRVERMPAGRHRVVENTAEVPAPPRYQPRHLLL